MSFIEKLRKTMQDSLKSPFCFECRETVKKLGPDTHICTHQLFRSGYHEFLEHVIVSNNNGIDEGKTTIEQIIQNSPAPGIFRIELSVNGVPVSVFPFFNLLGEKFQELISGEAQKQSQAVVQKYEERFTNLFERAKEALTDIFPSIQSQED